MSSEIIPVSTQAGIEVESPHLSSNPAAVYLARLAPGSRRTMRVALDTIAGMLTQGQADALQVAWGQLRYQHTQAIRSELAARYAPATTNKALAALRGVLKEAWRLGQMSAEDYQAAADIATVRAETLPRGRALTPGEIQALLAVCAKDTTPAGARDGALIAVLYGAGLRRSEAVALDLGEYTPESGQLTVRAGKGQKDRTVYLGTAAAQILGDWLQVRGLQAGPLFCGCPQGRGVQLRRLTDQAVRKALRKRAQAAGVPAFSPHDLRRSFISQLLDAGADIATVQKLAGHANVETTARYDRRGEAAKRKAAGLLHVPYVPREHGD